MEELGHCPIQKGGLSLIWHELIIITENPNALPSMNPRNSLRNTVPDPYCQSFPVLRTG
jgi:hypothetical protein